MSLPASVAEVLANHVTLEVECIDRMYLNLYQPKLVYPAGVVGFFKGHRGMPFVSSALMDPISKNFVLGIHRIVKDRGLDLVHFTKGQRKDDVANGYLATHNGFVPPDDPEALRLIGRSLTPARIETFVRKWLSILPHPFSPEDRAAGYHYDISILQAEFSLTQVLDRPLAGRVFFEEVIRENLDAGRPDQVSLTFGRRVTRRTPGRFRTRVLTEGVVPSLHVDYKSSRIKIYHKEGQALRTETTVNNTRDF